jgi:hypothetical protein
VAGSSEYGDGSSGSIKNGEFPDCLSVLLASQEGLCSMELVSWCVRNLDKDQEQTRLPPLKNVKKENVRFHVGIYVMEYIKFEQESEQIKNYRKK